MGAEDIREVLMLLSILIPTLEERRSKLTVLLDYINSQIKYCKVVGKVEILTDCDNRQRTTGAKRNSLLERATGYFSAFVDDDDWLSATYVRDIITIAKTRNFDCVGFYGEVWFRSSGNWARDGYMVHSVLCQAWTQNGNMYYRPPNHLNPIRTDISRQVKFRNITISEDHFWSLDMAKSRRVRNEVFLGGAPTYIYRSDTEKRGL